MAKGRLRDKRKEQLWRRWLREWRSSGLTVRAFCAQRGLTEPCFYAWRRELQQRQAETASFVPVRLVGAAPPTAADTLDLLLAGERTVRVRPGFDAATLRRLLAVLEETPC